MDDSHSRADTLSADILERYRSNSSDGRILGKLSLITAPFALFFEPTLFSLTAFFLGLIGLSIASKEQRPLSILGVVLALACGILGHIFQLAPL